MRKRLSVALGVLTALAVIAAVVFLSLAGGSDRTGKPPGARQASGRASIRPTSHGATHVATGVLATARTNPTKDHPSGGSSSVGRVPSPAGSSMPLSGVGVPLPTLPPLPGVVTQLCSQAERDAISLKASQTRTDLINRAVDAKATLLASVGGLLGGITGTIQHQLDAIDAQLVTDLHHADDLELQALALCQSGGNGLSVF